MPRPFGQTTARHGLIEPDITRIGNWDYGDYMWAVWWDDMASTIKIRRAGFEQDLDRIVTQPRGDPRLLKSHRDARVIV